MLLHEYITFPMKYDSFVRMQFNSDHEEYIFLKEYLKEGQVAYCVCLGGIIGCYTFEYGFIRFTSY